MNFVKIFITIITMFNFLFAKTLYINVVDRENPETFLKFYNEKIKKVKKGDTIVLFDSKTMQYIYSMKFNYEDVENYNDKYKLKKLLIKRLKKFEKKYNQYKNRLEEESVIIKEPNDFARQLRVVSQFIQLYKDKYKNIKVMFFGDSYLHNAYKHDFSKGIPSDGFIYLKESEFNTFADIDASNVEFAIFFDDEPLNKNRLFRFYRKLIEKKFNSRLDSFNDTATFDSDRDLTYEDKEFKRNELRVVGEKYKSDCTEYDIAKALYLDTEGSIEVSLKNSCRKDSIVTFYHNGTPIQKEMDSNGFVKFKIPALLGKNTIRYDDLNGEKKTIFDDTISAPSNDIEFIPNFATGEVTIKGYNPLRKNNSQVKIYYKTTGATLYLDVVNGKYETTVPIKVGKNVFEWVDMNGKKHVKTIQYDQRCADKITYDETLAKEYGILNIQLHNECRQDGTYVMFYYKGKEFKTIVEKGIAKKTILLNSDINHIFYKNFDGDKAKAATIKIREFKNLIRFSIDYKDNVLVLMNIFEPNLNKKFGVIKSIDYNKPNLFIEGHLHINNRKSKKGNIIIADIPSVKNYLSKKFIKVYHQVYVTRRDKQEKGNLLFYVDYFSRHGRYNKQPPLCGKRSLGGVAINYEIIDNGVVEKSKKFLNPARCKESIEDGKLYPHQDDDNLIPIKRIVIQ